MNKKISIGATIALMIISIALTISVTMVVAMRIFNSSVNDVTQRRAMYQYVTEIDTAVRPHYLGTIDEEKLRTALAQGYVDGIGDPYAAYLSASEYKAVQQTRSGKLTGYGIELSKTEDGMPQITEVSKQSPAASAGVQKGDIVVSLDGTEVTADTYDTVAEKLGVTTSGDKVLIGLRRGDSELSVDLTSASFDVVTVEGRMVGSVAVIRITAFTETTPAQFKTVYNQLDREGATGFVFDLRNTADGVLSAAQEVVAYLMPRGSYAKITEQQTDGTSQTTEMMAEDTYQMSKPSATLVNSRTSDGAELFAGVLQEHALTTVIGSTTAGHGLVQDYYTIATDGAAIRLSVASLVLKKGGEIEGVGITPNKEVLLTPEQEERLGLLTDEEDTQLQEALTAVLSGGMVTPPTTTLPETEETTAPEGETTAGETEPTETPAE